MVSEKDFSFGKMKFGKPAFDSFNFESFEGFEKSPGKLKKLIGSRNTITQLKKAIESGITPTFVSNFGYEAKFIKIRSGLLFLVYENGVFCEVFGRVRLVSLRSNFKVNSKPKKSDVIMVGAKEKIDNLLRFTLASRVWIRSLTSNVFFSTDLEYCAANNIILDCQAKVACCEEDLLL